MLLTSILRDLQTDREFHKKLAALTIPITLQSLMLALVAAADALMLGQLGQNPMAAVSLATQIQFVQNMILFGVVSGTGILGAQYWGKRDIPVLGRILGSSVREAFLVSLIFFAACRWFPEPLMKLFASDPELIAIGAEYLKVAAWSYLITGVSQSYLALMRVSGHAGRAAWISSGAVVLNIVLNGVLIFGLAAIPALGVRGAAWATVLARVIELGWCIFSSCQKGFIRVKMQDLFRWDWPLIRDFWRYAAPVLASCLLWGVGFTAYTALMGHMGPDAAAANAVAAVVRDLLCCLCNGIGGAAAVLIGNELGAGALERARSYGQRSMVLSFLIGFACTLLILASIPLLAVTVKLTAQAQDYLTGMFVILSIYMIGRCVCTVVINGIFSAGGDTCFDMYSLMVCMWGIALPCAFLGAFYFHWPVLVVYACTCLDEVGKVPWVIWHFFRYKWVKNLTR